MRVLLMLLTLLPFVAMAQDTLYVKGFTNHAVTITRVEDGKVYYDLNGREAFIPEANLDYYYWSKAKFVPKKYDNRIIIETADSPEEAFVKFTGLLAEAGFPIDSSNKNLGSISTKQKRSKGVMNGFTLYAVVKGSDKTSITLLGMFKTSGFNSEQLSVFNYKSIIEYGGKADGPIMKLWQEMDKVAKAYPNAIITYSKQ